MLRSLWSALLSVALTCSNAHADGSRLEQRLHESFAAGELSGLHGVYILRDGELWVQAFFDGPDQRWGTNIGQRQHSADSLHDLRSVTKSITGLLYGIALEQGLVPPPDAGLLAQFPEYADLQGDPLRDGITVAEALNMTMGIAWDETLPYSDPHNSEIAMERAPDRVRYVLEQPMDHPPGTRWVYNGGATALIGALIAQGTDMPIDAYAEQVLFEPLGIIRYEWVAGADGIPSAASGLRLSASSLSRLGQMLANDGRYAGQQVVPEAWVNASFEPQAVAGTLRYSNFWWLAEQGNPPLWAAGFGNGRQRLVINRSAGIVMVVFAGNYNQTDAWKLPVTIISDFVVPALQ